MKDQRWANRPDAVAKRPDKRKRLVFVLVAFALVAGALLLFERLGGGRISEELNPAPGMAGSTAEAGGDEAAGARD